MNAGGVPPIIANIMGKKILNPGGVPSKSMDAMEQIPNIISIFNIENSLHTGIL